MINNNRRWTIADDAELDHMLNQGLSYKAIALKLGRTDKAVMAYRMRKDMPTSKERVSAAAVASATAERMRIVKWLRSKMDDYAPDDNYAGYYADEINNGEHLK